MIDAKKLEAELMNLPEGWIVLLETSAENALEAGLAAIKILTDKNYYFIVISASRPCSNLLSLYEKNSIDSGKITVIDCVCKSQNLNVKDSSNVLHLESVSALNDISISIGKIIGKIKGNKFICIDSVTTMLIHNKPDVFARFIHSVLTKMRINEISGLLLSLESETNKEVRAEIAQLCDKIIRI